MPILNNKTKLGYNNGNMPKIINQIHNNIKTKLGKDTKNIPYLDKKHR